MSGVWLARSRVEDPETMQEVRRTVQSMINSGRGEDFIRTLNGLVSEGEFLSQTGFVDEVPIDSDQSVLLT